MLKTLSKVKNQLAIWIVAVLASFILSPVAFAGNSISSIDQQVSIDKDAVATITETIDYNFENARRGIERYYDTVTKTSTGKYNQVNFELLSVSQDGATAKVTLDKVGGQYRLKIGDANITITGAHRYQIKYKVWPVVREDTSGDFINYNITGNNWSVPIQKTTAIITLPEGVVATQTRCYTGPSGSTAQDCLIYTKSNIVGVLRLNPLNAKEGMTANILTPKGSFSTYLKPTDKAPAGSVVDYTYVILFVAVSIFIILVGCIIRLIKLLKKRKARKAETIVAQYSLPKGMSAAEAGILVDDKADMSDITATIIDLAERGYMKIKNIDNTDYEFSILKSEGMEMQPFEKTILRIFSDSANSKTHKVLLSSINGDSSAVSIKSVKQQLVASLEEKGYYHKGRTSTLISSASIAVVIFFQVTLFFWASMIALIALPFVCAYLAYRIAKTSDLTIKGYDAWALVEGLKLYLTVAEKDRINFHEAPKKTPAQFSKLLPAAVALGVEEEWAKQFKDLNISKSVNWYDSTSPFDAVVLVGVLGTDLNSSFIDSFLGASSSSSGDFGSGGFSGGGDFGGGGGGDW